MRTILSFLFPLAIILVTFVSCGTKTNSIDLSGEWILRIDSLNMGIPDGWFNKMGEEIIILPGSMAGNGKGKDITIDTDWTGSIVDRSWYTDTCYAKYREPGNILIPFWLQPVKKYTGSAWYQREVYIPSNWKGKTIILNLERCHWETRLWIDSVEIGSDNSLATPHIYDLTEYLGTGSHRLSICVDNRIKDIKPGINSHSISDHTQTNWNGIIGEIYLTSRPSVYIRNAYVYPDIDTRTAWVDFIIENRTGQDINCKLEINAFGEEGEVNHITEKLKRYLTIPPGKNSNRIEILLGEEMLTWDEFSPAVYRLNASIDSKKGKDFYSTTFGMREFTVDGTRFSINGLPVFLRGTLECAVFPETGYPSTDIAEWERIFTIIKEHGLNHMRFHSWCPPEAAFEAADRAGIYLQVECSSWANSGASIGDGKPLDDWLMMEAERIINAYGNHPSFCMMAYGNEPAGEYQAEWLGKFVNHWKKKDPRRVYTGAAGWPEIPENDYHNIPQPRIQAWGQELESIINSETPRTDFDWSERISRYTVPVVSHEIGQWCVYPDFNEIDRYTGVLRANNFRIFRETLKEAGLVHLADDYLMASGKLQTLCYKADIEAALRTQGMAGFQLLDLHDFPGQGTALVGILNAFWKEKGYTNPEQFSRFCNTTVPLCRLDKRIFTEHDTISAAFEVSHFGKEVLSYPDVCWRFVSGEDTLVKGVLDIQKIDLGNCINLGSVNIPVKDLINIVKIKMPMSLRIELSVDEWINTWDIWLYQQYNTSGKGESENVYVTSKIDERSMNVLKEGGNVLLTLEKGTLKSEYGGNIGVGFSSIFWNTAWTRGQKPHTLGILCDPEHPALKEFPSETHSNWQWWDAMSNSSAIIMSEFSTRIDPIVRIIDDWFNNRSLGLIFEAGCENGKIIICGADLLTDIANRPAAAQLMISLIHYMNSSEFTPSARLEIQEIKNISSYNK